MNSKTYKFMPLALIVLATGVAEAMVSLTDFHNSIIYSMIIFAIALVVLSWAADIFAETALRIGDHLGLSGLATGVLIISLGTSAPEIFSSLGAIMNDSPKLVVGNVLGTVIANTLLGIGVAAVVSKTSMTVHEDVVGTQMAIFMGACVIVVLSFMDGQLGKMEAILMACVFFLYIGSSAKSGRKEDHIRGKLNKDDIISLGVGIVCLILLFRSGDLVISSMISGAVLLGFSEIKVATTVLAIGTSIPEVATAFSLARRGKVDAIFGEILGSNIIALMAIFGFGGLIATIAMPGALLWFLLGSTVGTAVLTYVIIADHKVNKLEGFMFLAIFAIWIQILVNFDVSGF